MTLGSRTLAINHTGSKMTNSDFSIHKYSSKPNTTHKFKTVTVFSVSLFLGQFLEIHQIRNSFQGIRAQLYETFSSFKAVSNYPCIENTEHYKTYQKKKVVQNKNLPSINRNESKAAPLAAYFKLVFGKFKMPISWKGTRQEVVCHLYSTIKLEWALLSDKGGGGQTCKNTSQIV